MAGESWPAARETGEQQEPHPEGTNVQQRCGGSAQVIYLFKTAEDHFAAGPAWMIQPILEIYSTRLPGDAILHLGEQGCFGLPEPVRLDFGRLDLPEDVFRT